MERMDWPQCNGRPQRLDCYWNSGCESAPRVRSVQSNRAYTRVLSDPETPLSRTRIGGDTLCDSNTTHNMLERYKE